MIRRIVIVVSLLGATAPLLAGMCADVDTSLKMVSAHKPAEDLGSAKTDVLHALLCLYFDVEYWDMGYQNLARAGFIARQRQARATYHGAVGEVVRPYLGNPAEDVRCAAGAALAFHGWSDAYETVVSCQEIMPDLGYYGAGRERQLSMKALVLAMLGDERAASWIEEQFASLARRYRSRPQFSVPCKMSLLNALFHLRAAVSIPFATKVAETDPSEEVRARAHQVIAHIREKANET